jgi:lysophospholipase L1-like esterase
VITDPNARRVLCFGDSNTYGTCRRSPAVEGASTPDPDYVRLNPDRRWPGVLQHVLGTGYEVIEEALNGRTTDLDEPGRPGLNGRAYFVPCLLSHQPVDVVVVWLGGNDLKPVFARTPEAIAEALGHYVDDVAELATDQHGAVPLTILVGPTVVNDAAPAYRDLVGDDLDPHLPQRAHQLAEEVRRVARQRQVGFVAAADVASPGDDGIHLDMASHARLGELLATTIVATLSRPSSR